MPIKLLGVKYGKGTATHRAPAKHARCCWLCAFGTVVNHVRSVYMEEQKPKGSGMEMCIRDRTGAGPRSGAVPPHTAGS